MTVCTTAFERMAEVERHALGAPELELAIIDHPLMSMDPDQLDEAVSSMMPQLSRLFGAPA